MSGSEKAFVLDFPLFAYMFLTFRFIWRHYSGKLTGSISELTNFYWLFLHCHYLKTTNKNKFECNSIKTLINFYFKSIFGATIDVRANMIVLAQQALQLFSWARNLSMGHKQQIDQSANLPILLFAPNVKLTLPYFSTEYVLFSLLSIKYFLNV